MNKKTKKTFYLGITSLIIGIALGLYANFSTYIDEQGILHENFSTPLSAILVLLGIIMLIISGSQYLLRKKSK